jgi:hypothetical protein
MIETVNVLMLISIPIVYWRLRKRHILWLKFTIFLLFAANLILNHATFIAIEDHNVSKEREFYWLAFASRFCVLCLSGYGIFLSFRPKSTKPPEPPKI